MSEWQRDGKTDRQDDRMKRQKEGKMGRHKDGMIERKESKKIERVIAKHLNVCCVKGHQQFWKLKKMKKRFNSLKFFF